MKPGLSLRMSQHLALTPQLQQSIRLLQLSTLDLAAEVEQMLGDNPFLERSSEDAPQSEGDGEGDAAIYSIANGAGSIRTTGQNDAENDDFGQSGASDASGAAEQPELADFPDWGGDGSSDLAPDDSEWGGDAPARQQPSGDSDSEAEAADLAHEHQSLQQFLRHQALALRLSELDRAALHFLIESLNDDGYLSDTLPELARALLQSADSDRSEDGEDGGNYEDYEDYEDYEELLHRFTVARHLLRSLEPTGVGAHGLAECLTLQLQALQSDAAADPAIVRIALCACQQPLEWLARRDVRRLGQACGTNEERMRAALGLIARLEPRPGRRFAHVERNAIIPDVLVRPIGTSGQQWSVRLNPDVMPRLRVHDIYARALRGHKGSDGHQALQQRLQEARWFIKNIQQRFDTILRVSQAIVERQKNFFVHGALAMRPLVLREIADELGLHESTISRVTSAKYMATPQGTFELKHFFGSGLGTDTGGNASSTAVRALLQQFIAAESAAKPLSDSQLAEMLKEQGIECARRTVAKYREGLKIPVASLRKAL
jgi:RNA polymerase sigma-54 factor